VWDDRYSEDGYAYGTEPNDFVREQAHRIPQGPVLCVAEGEGRNAVHIAGLGHAVTAVDASSVGMRKASGLAAERGLELSTVVADLSAYAVEAGTWAGVVSVFAHVPPQVRVDLHRRLVAGLRPGGVLILEAYTPDQIGRGTGGPPVPGPMMTLEGLRTELAGLDLVIGREVVREVHEGRYHTGEAAVVQIVGVAPGK
jgi:SAM-dependent methyltransferase